VTDDWTPILVLPNVRLTNAIDSRLAVLAPSDDPRVRGYAKAHPYFARFQRSFTDPFGRRIHPSVLLVHNDAPASVRTGEALASFRDSIALSVIPYNRALELLYPRHHRIVFSNTFAFHPWSVSRDEDSLIALTPAMSALDDVERFRGQSSPDLSPMPLTQFDIDAPLLTQLLKCWHRRYAGRVRWKERALFRSLNMANQAAHTPAIIATTLFDVGRSLALWVSAFEILVHPRKGKSGLDLVYALLESTKWAHKSSSVRRYSAHERNESKKKNTARRVMACWVYGQIHQTRNEFLHGNPVSPGRLFLNGSEHHLGDYAAPLYRLALTAFLPVAFTRQMPQLSEATKCGHYIADHMQFISYQQYIERALGVRKGHGGP
jgi:hypothetical protein